MEECHITLFDPWFPSGDPRSAQTLLGTSQLLRLEISHKDRQLFEQTTDQIDPNPSTLSPLAELLVGYLQQAVVSINKFPAAIHQVYPLTFQFIKKW